MREKAVKRIRKHNRLRKKIMGTEKRPRCCIYRSLNNIQAQLINDIDNKTLCSVSTYNKNFRKKLARGGNIQAARLLGEILAEQAKKQGITEVVFDRGGFMYHGRIKALAESAREHGLKF